MAKVSLWRLRVIESTVNASTIGRSDSQTTTAELVATTIAKLGRFINDLIKGRKDIVSKLNLSYRR